MTLHELWDDLVPPEKRWLSLIIFASLCAHTSFFFLFKVIPPKAQEIPRRPAQVALLAKTTPSIVWLDWRDPSAIALPRSPLPKLKLPEDLPALPDRYDRLPELSEELHVGSLADDRPALSLRTSTDFLPETLKPSRVDVPVPPSPGGTEIQFLGALSGREVLYRKEFPKPSVSDVLRVTVLNVGISAAGSVDALMVEETSVDAAVDQMAITTLRQWKFKPRKIVVPGQEMDWGKVIVYWDYQGKPRSTVAPPLP